VPQTVVASASEARLAPIAGVEEVEAAGIEGEPELVSGTHLVDLLQPDGDENH